MTFPLHSPKRGKTSSPGGTIMSKETSATEPQSEVSLDHGAAEGGGETIATEDTDGT